MRSLFLLGFLIMNVATFVASQTDRDESFQVHATSIRLRSIHVRKLFDEQLKVLKKLVQKVAKTDQEKFALSPFITTLDLSMLSIAARKHTDAAFREFFEFEPSHIPRKVASGSILHQLNSYLGMEFATGLFVPSNIRVDPDLTEILSISYDATVKKIDFEKSREASRLINRWCNDKTEDHVKEVVTPADFNAHTSLFLVNCMDFTGNWMKNFGGTRLRPFYLENGRKKKVMSMVGKQNVRYGELPEVNAKFIELSILDQDEIHVMNMIVILPKERNGLAHLDKNFHNINFTDLFNRTQYTEMMVMLPKFKIKSHLHLNNLLAEIGLSAIFDKSADFSGVIDSQHPYLDQELLDSKNPDYYYQRFRLRNTSGPRQLFISNIIQKFSLEINDRPVKSATASDLLTSCTMDNKTDFIADRSFYYIITTNGEIPMILVTGRYTIE